MLTSGSLDKAGAGNGDWPSIWPRCERRHPGGMRTEPAPNGAEPVRVFLAARRP
jgi:hypothetical protein